MPDTLLTVLRLLLLLMIWLFFLRVLRLLWLGPQVAAPAPTTTVDVKPAARPAAERVAESGKPTVRVTSAGALKGKEFIVAGEATIGRGAGCQVMLSEPMVSQLHARLFRDGKRLADRGPGLHERHVF